MVSTTVHADTTFPDRSVSLHVPYVEHGEPGTLVGQVLAGATHEPSTHRLYRQSLFALHVAPLRPIGMDAFTHNRLPSPIVPVKPFRQDPHSFGFLASKHGKRLRAAQNDGGVAVQLTVEIVDDAKLIALKVASALPDANDALNDKESRFNTLVVVLIATVTGADVLAQARYWLQQRLMILIDLFCDDNPSGNCVLTSGNKLNALMINGGVRIDDARE